MRLILRVGERALGYWQSLIDWDGPLLIRSARVGPSTNVRRQRTCVVLLLDIVDGRNAWMVEAGENLRFSLEPSEPIRIAGKRLRQDLQRDLAVQRGIGGLIDLAHPTLANEGGDIVAPYALESH